MKVKKSKMRKFTVKQRKAIRENGGKIPINIVLEIYSENMKNGMYQK